MKPIFSYQLSTLFIFLFTFCATISAAPRIAILDFELNDITSLPNTAQEISRTASIKPFLEQALSQQGDYQFMQISPAQQKAANPGFGYLFKFDENAADLANQYGADWIIVGQHSKPSFLFSYLMVHVVNVKTGKLIGRYELELKGNHEKVTRRGTRKLAQKISVLISSYKPQKIINSETSLVPEHLLEN